MSRERRETVADWLMVLGAVGLLGSLFLTWSHQFSPAFLASGAPRTNSRASRTTRPRGRCTRRRTWCWRCWPPALVAVALVGNRAARITAGLAAIGRSRSRCTRSAARRRTAPTSSIRRRRRTCPSDPKSGAGEIVALAALGVALAGLALSFTAD